METTGAAAKTSVGDSWPVEGPGFYQAELDLVCLTHVRVTSLSTHGGTLYAGTFSGRGHSADPGQAWTAIGSSIGVEVLGIGETDAGDLWAVLGFGGTLVQASGEEGFAAENDSLPYANFSRLQTDGDDVYGARSRRSISQQLHSRQSHTEKTRIAPRADLQR